MRMIAATTAALLAASPVLASDWTGAYVGGQIGDMKGNGDGGIAADGTTYGLHAGYNHDFGSVIVGGEIDTDFTNAKNNFGDKIDGISRLKAKVGYDFGPVMAYATAGVAYGRAGGDSDTGNVYGLGVSYIATENWILSGEYLQHDFKSFGGSGLDSDAGQLSLRASYKF